MKKNDPYLGSVNGKRLLGAAAVAALGLIVAARAYLRQSRAFDLQGRVALVTGGSRGLGLLLARRLAVRGAKVAICARNPDELARAEADLREISPDILAVRADITDRAQIDDLVTQVATRFGRSVDILINNAGLIQVGPQETMVTPDFEASLDLHLWAPYHLIQAVLPAMRQKRAGRIVNIASIGGKVSVPHLLPYSTGKFALVGYSEGLRSSLLKDNIYVTTVNPGLIRTGSPRNAQFKGQHRKEYAWFALADSLPGLSQSADDCANEIIDALIHGDAELTTSLPGKAVALLHGVLPGVTADILGIVNAVLPAPNGSDSIGTARLPGSASESSLAPSFLTALTQKAEVNNNERAN